MGPLDRIPNSLLPVSLDWWISDATLLEYVFSELLRALTWQLWTPTAIRTTTTSRTTARTARRTWIAC